MKMKHLLGLFVLAILVVGCTDYQVPPPKVPSPSSGTQLTQEEFNPVKDIQKQSFSDEAEFTSFVRQHHGSSGGYFDGGIRRLGEVAMESMAVAADAAGAPSVKTMDYSETNVQVQGVDEADMLKTDGEYIYTITDNTVFIIKAYPGQDAEVIHEIEFENIPQGLFLDGDRLAVFGNFYDLDYFEEIGFVPRQGMTFFEIYDVSDPESPTLEEDLKFEGRYFEARMTDDWVYFVTMSSPELRPIPMPYVIRGDAVENVRVSDIFYYPMPYNNVQFANIHAINLENADSNSKTVAVEGGQHMYMNHEHIFISSTQNVNEWEIQQEMTMKLLEPRLTRSDEELVKKIKNTDDMVLSPVEKRSKIYEVYSIYLQYMDNDEREDFQDEVDKLVKEEIAKYESLEWTVLHKVSFNSGKVSVEESGTVPGTIHNQFAMDEKDGVLRVATTINPWWNRRWFDPMLDAVEESADIRVERRSEPTNNVYTFDENMERLDELEGLAVGERIFATRFVDDRLYMVTFRQVDPFFVIDLSDPENIKNMGELKIPGFSRYLHPYDEDHIIGIGRDATETGRQQGIKISLFDVSNVEKPEEVASWVADERYSQTSAEWEHKAFLFSREKNLLVIPAYSHDYSRYGDSETYNGALVFHITDEDIDLRGLIDHSQGTNTKRYYGQMVERSLYIEDLLYTKSPNLLRINELDDLSKVKNVDLEPNRKSPYPVY